MTPSKKKPAPPTPRRAPAAPDSVIEDEDTLRYDEESPFPDDVQRRKEAERSADEGGQSITGGVERENPFER